MDLTRRTNGMGMFNEASSYAQSGGWKEKRKTAPEMGEDCVKRDLGGEWRMREMGSGQKEKWGEWRMREMGEWRKRDGEWRKREMGEWRMREMGGVAN